MMKPHKTLGAAVIVGSLLLALSACQKEEGPVEKAGKEIDQAAEAVGEQMEKAGDSIQDAAKGEDKD